MVRAVNSAADAVIDTELGVVLAAGALPGEEVRLRGVRKEGRVLRGQVEELRLASAERVEPPCPHASSCGGCPLSIATPTMERRIKQDLLERALADFAPRPAVEWVDAPSRDGYRTRARLHFRAERVGYRARRGAGLVDVTSCRVLVPTLAAALDPLREQAHHFRGSGEISLALGAGGGAVVAIETRQMQPPAFYAALERMATEPGIAGISARVEGTAAARFGQVEPVVEGADGKNLRLASGGFAQAQEAINQQLVRYVAAQADVAGQRVLELYSGAGNMSVLLAAGAARFESVESSPSAVEAARENLRSRELRGKLVCGRAEDHAKGATIDVLVLDPPREGALAALEAALMRRPAKVVYVSCQPSTLGRDLGLLQRAGYALVAVSAFDMFPQTAHLESVVTLTRTI